MFKKLLFVCLFCISFLTTFAQYSWNNLPKAIEPLFKKDTFNIIDYGAKSNGYTLNTQSINNAITDCSKKGGGVVVLPAGLWLTGPIILQSNVNLHIESAAILQFTDDFNQYPLVVGNWEGKVQARNQSPISGDNLVNVAITGKGIIDGNGDVWRMIGKDKLTESEWKEKVASGGIVSADGKTWFPSEKTKKAFEEKLDGVITKGKTLKDFENIKDFLRPNLLVISNSKKVLLEGVTFQNSPAWCLHLLLCQDVTVKNAHVKNPEYAQNGDGIDVESCKDVLIDGSVFDAGDDGICIKSGKDEEGRKRNIATENVLIKNCVVYKAHGGFVIGSEMSGGAKNIFVADCNFIGTDKGLRFKTTRGRGGVVENIYCKNIFMKDIVQEAIYFDMYYFSKSPKPGEKLIIPPVTEETPQFKNFYIGNIICNGAEKGVFIRGLPEMNIKNINLSNIYLKANKAIDIIEVEDIYLNNVEVNIKNNAPMVYVENSKNIQFNKFAFNQNSPLIFNISGEKTKQIKMLLNGRRAEDVKPIFVKGAAESALDLN